MRRFLGIELGLLIVLFGCASTKVDLNYVSDPSIKANLDPLTLEVASEPRLLRVDLVRATHIETRNRTVYNGTSSSVVSESVEVPNPYHYIALNFGNGLMMDYNHNLFVDLSRFYAFDNRNPDHGFRADVDLYGAKSTVTNQDGRYDAVTKGLFGGTRTITVNGSITEIQEPGFLGGKSKIVQEGTSLSYDPGAFLGLGKVTLNQTDPNLVSIPAFFGKNEFRKVGNDRIEFDKSFTLAQLGNTITIQFQGLFGIKAQYVFFRTATGFVFYDTTSLDGLEVHQEGNKILYYTGKTKVGEITLTQ